MLFTQTVEPNTFSILEEIIQVPELKNFALVGGTALSLLFGHRKSEDLDLFSTDPFENEVIIKALIKNIKMVLIIEAPICALEFFVLLIG
jgi:hypothetical protein